MTAEDHDADAIRREKQREYSRRYREANREKVRERARRYNAAHPEKSQQWREANREKVREQDRERARQRRAANPEKHREANRAYWARNPEKLREAAGRSREANREKIREMNRQSYARNREAKLEKNRQYKAANSEKMRSWRLRAKHGMLPEDWVALWDAQQGLCYLCDEPMSVSDVVIEHDHSCCTEGRSCKACRRGLAHNACNQLIGMAADDADKLARIAENLRVAKESALERMAGNAVRLCLPDSA